MKQITTLAMVHKKDKILLGMKKRGFGEGYWNGFGGKINPGEKIETAATRELWEECGIKAEKIDKRGLLYFEFENNPKILEVHIFDVERFGGEPRESEEMRPGWFSKNKIPFHSMWPDDPHWLPLFLQGKKFKGKFYLKDTKTLIKYNLEEVEGF